MGKYVFLYIKNSRWILLRSVSSWIFSFFNLVCLCFGLVLDALFYFPLSPFLFLINFLLVDFLGSDLGTIV